MIDNEGNFTFFISLLRVFFKQWSKNFFIIYKTFYSINYPHDSTPCLSICFILRNLMMVIRQWKQLLLFFMFSVIQLRVSCDGKVNGSFTFRKNCTPKKKEVSLKSVYLIFHWYTLYKKAAKINQKIFLRVIHHFYDFKKLPNSLFLEILFTKDKA